MAKIVNKMGLRKKALVQLPFINDKERLEQQVYETLVFSGSAKRNYC
ncbi:hypothetical protein SAMN05216283_101855 [Sunxiuqinia elliptica]|uniref:Uncharacterized protein n=1 Tax=Sunxiuqinia elliptica TaxID=655355 RepID=A0A1I2CWG3_9BACT|nr:hypothetical protein SAMN05216283_101855 [Sunxiuqinia elliptica]